MLVIIPDRRLGLLTNTDAICLAEFSAGYHQAGNGRSLHTGKLVGVMYSVNRDLDLGFWCFSGVSCLVFGVSGIVDRNWQGAAVGSAVNKDTSPRR